MNRSAWMMGVCLGLVASLALGAPTASIAAQSEPPTAASSRPSAPAANTTKAQSSPMTPVEVARQVAQLERIKHRFELSAGNDRGSHSALAARHIQTAINEMKIEMQGDANGKKSTQGSQTQAVRSTTSAANASTKKN